MSHIIRAQDELVGYRSKSYQNICIPYQIACLMQVRVYVRSNINDILTQRENLTALTKSFKSGELSRCMFRFQPTLDFVYSDDGKGQL
jgi:hypothetical protein